MRAPEEAPPDSKANTHSAKPSHTNLLASAAWAMLSAYNPSRARQYVVQDISYAESAEPDDDKVPSHKPNDALKDATTKVLTRDKTICACLNALLCLHHAHGIQGIVPLPPVPC
eukprot:927776-Pleurochrysis_carterae.AAC.2